jgi:hypothetical protein
MNVYDLTAEGPWFESCNWLTGQYYCGLIIVFRKQYQDSFFLIDYYYTPAYHKARTSGKTLVRYTFKILSDACLTVKLIFGEIRIRIETQEPCETLVGLLRYK